MNEQEHRFDSLARSLATTRSRRLALKQLGAALAGAVAAAVAPSWARGVFAHSDGPTAPAPCDAQNPCGGGYCCDAGKCVPPTQCSSGCCDATTHTCQPLPAPDDPNNCGICGTVCPSGACTKGSCTCDADNPCPDGLACCNGFCVNLGADPLNCGSCNNACGFAIPCVAGQCAGGDVCGTDICGPNQRCCFRTVTAADDSGTPGPPGIECADVMTDNENCGGCGIICDQGQTCQNGVCMCGATCTGCCTGNTCVTPPNNVMCGVNGATCIACPAGYSCIGGACCPPQLVCGTTCCQTGQTCQNGVCQMVCSQQNCAAGCCQGGKCQPGSADNACGAGGKTCQTCTAPLVCQGGSCQCPPTMTACGMTCCPQGTPCTNGQCQQAPGTPNVTPPGAC